MSKATLEARDTFGALCNAKPSVSAFNKSFAPRKPSTQANVVRDPGYSAWTDLERRVRSKVLRMWDEGFVAHSLPLNLRYEANKPMGIAFCRSTQDVAETLLWCLEYAIPLVVRSGGHSYGGFSTTNGLMINLSLMNEVLYDTAQQTLTFAGGTTIGHAVDVLSRYERTFTHGRCPSVGLAAMVLGGGVGFNMRSFGLACDHLIGTEIVTADGRVHQVNRVDNPDLFWACRGGGGGNCGISTSFTLRTFPAETVTVFSMTWTLDTKATFLRLMSALDGAPNGLGSRVALFVTGANRRICLSLLGQFRGGAEDFANILAGVGEPQQSELRETEYWNGQLFLWEYLDPLRFHESSAFLPRAPTRDLVELAFEYLSSWPGTSGEADVRFFQTGGAVNDVSADATAFVHRDSRWLMVVGLTWDQAEQNEIVQRNLEWQRRGYRSMQPFSTGGSYQNLTDPTLDNWQDCYYGSNFTRLKEIKMAVDPEGVFSFPQSI